MPTLIMKVNPREIAGDNFRPAEHQQWEACNFSPPKPTRLGGQRTSVDDIPVGVQVFVWTHTNPRMDGKLRGEGIKARGLLDFIAPQGQKQVTVRLREIEFLKPPLSRDKLEAVRQSSKVIEDLLSYTLSRSLFLEEAEEADFLAGLSRAQELYSEKLRAVADLTSSTAPSTGATSGDEWTDAELAAVMSAYLELLAAEQAGQPLNKAEVNRSLRSGALHARSMSSVEYRMQNFSAFFQSKGLPVVQGYKPAGNIGRGVTERLEAIFASLGDASSYRLTPDAAEARARASRLRPGLKRAPLGSPNPTSRETRTTSFVRSPAVVAYVLAEAAGRCEYCGSQAPFLTSDGEPFLEVHHPLPLADLGPDTVDNAAAVCPNCHRAFHHAVDRDERTTRLLAKVPRLRDYRSSN